MSDYEKIENSLGCICTIGFIVAVIIFAWALITPNSADRQALALVGIGIAILTDLTARLAGLIK